MEDWLVLIGLALLCLYSGIMMEVIGFYRARKRERERSRQWTKMYRQIVETNELHEAYGRMLIDKRKRETR